MSKLSSSIAGNITRKIAAIAMFALSPVVSAAQDGVEYESESYTHEAALADSSRWPVELTDDGRTFLIYQPQVDRWQNQRLEARSAVSVRNNASGRQNFGVVYFSARSERDPDGDLVSVRDPVVSTIDFPAVTTGVDDYKAVLTAHFATLSWRVAQDRLQSDMEIDRLARQEATRPLKNDPPRILYSERPALLVPVDGSPVLRAVAGTGLLRVTNTRALILHDKASSRYYLYVSDRWMQTQSLDGPWTVVVNPPSQLEQARNVVTQQFEVDLLEADEEDGEAVWAPDNVYVSTSPTELLQTDGPAQYSPIEGTQLLYVTNSPNRLFLDLREQNFYVLISGRWYRSATLANGQWSYVPAASLPRDFAMIPDEHPTETVRAAVPGTPQAREAVIANSVPQVATVTRTAARLEITYDGDPVFQPIAGTALQHAVNSPVPVIRVSGDAYYALDNGVWFVAASPFGPWIVASHVPPVIYSIPRSSPLYYVTYVRVYDATPEVVYVGYTPGYVGSYVSSDYVVVYGTGWHYRPWIGSVWYGVPVTWGFGFSFVNSWWHPYPLYATRHVLRRSARSYRPWWGPWHQPVIARVRADLAAGGGRDNHASRQRASIPLPHQVTRIYDRWDRRNVGWKGAGPDRDNERRAIALPRRSENPDFARPNQSDDQDNRNRNRTDVRQRREFDRPPASPDGRRPSTGQTPSAVQRPSPVQRPLPEQRSWRRPPETGRGDQTRTPSAPQRVQPPATGNNERRSSEIRRQRPPATSGRADEGVQRSREGSRPAFERPPAQVQQDRPARSLPQTQVPQRLPSTPGPYNDRRSGIEIPSAQRVSPPPVSTSPPVARSQNPGFSNPAPRTERAERATPRAMERGADRPQSGNAEGRRQGAGRERNSRGDDERRR